jgi:hypothetical protein
MEKQEPRVRRDKWFQWQSYKSSTETPPYSSFFSFFFLFDMGLFGRVFPLYSSRATFISNRIFAAQRVRGRSQEQQGRIKKRGFLRLLQPPTSRVESSRVRSRSPAESICICQTASRATCVINIRERKTPPPFIDVWT